jgi:hypothetical protein
MRDWLFRRGRKSRAGWRSKLEGFGLVSPRDAVRERQGLRALVIHSSFVYILATVPDVPCTT